MFQYPWTKTENNGLYGLKHQIVEMSPMRDDDDDKSEVKCYSAFDLWGAESCNKRDFCCFCNLEKRENARKS